MARSIEGGSGNFSEQDLTNFILEQQQTLEQQEDDRPSSRVEGRRRADQCTSTSQSSKDDKVVAQDTLQSGVAPTGVTFSGVEAESKDENCASDASVDSMPYTYEFGARRSASGMMSVLVLNGPACFVGGRLASTGEPQVRWTSCVRRYDDADKTISGTRWHTPVPWLMLPALPEQCVLHSMFERASRSQCIRSYISGFSALVLE